ncbi:MAG TPA: class I SAM-dependent methyltransferase [Thermoguttaceae bacterium]|nr:class I SAM-dependent methyltransferase [Thermoguttaceae bacterium]
MLPRVLEPEVMDSPSEAADYDAMDHAEVNRVFVADLLAAGLPDGPILDLGAGTALIPIELARRCDTVRLVAADAARHMLHAAEANVRRAGLSGRITLQCVDAKRLPYADASFATVMSNSLVHHVADPWPVLAEAWRVLTPGGLLFFRDLARPADDRAVARVVDTYAAGANAHQRRMLEDSLRAALTVEEMASLIAKLGAGPGTLTLTSDRHWTWMARKSEPRP